MFLWAGLGNPGRAYAHTRHNLGIFVLKDIFPEHTERKHKKLGYIEYEQNLLQNVKIIFPQGYMNHSGIYIKRACEFYKVGLKDLVVFHDEIDLPIGEVQYKFGGGHNGHNGLRDIILRMDDANFHRIRLGVGRPENPIQSVSDFVLEKTPLSQMVSRTRVIQVLQENGLWVC